MAEWSIAPVLKTDVLKGTGGSNPSLSARNQEQRKLLLILFYVDTGSLLTSRHIKQNQHKHRQVVADFLQRITKQGWASKAKPIPTPYFKKPRTRRRGISTLNTYKTIFIVQPLKFNFGGCFLFFENNALYLPRFTLGAGLTY